MSSDERHLQMSRPMRAVAEAFSHTHRTDKWRWLALGGTEEQWEMRDTELQANLRSIPEPDYP